MGVVYQAIDRESDAEVAVKTLRDLDAEGLLRFKNEFRSIQGLQHPNLVSLGELIEAEGHWFFTMELVDGIDFYSYARPRRRATDRSQFSNEPTAPAGQWQRPQAQFDEKRLRAALGQLCEGLAALHRAGFVHRDVKPSNIMVTPDGRVVLLDFGFVIAVAQHSSDRIVGTAAYMSPEQAASMPVGPEADWYSVGVVLYEALTGTPPIDGMPLEVLMQKQHVVPKRPSELVDGIPEDLDELCTQLLAIRSDDRPDGAEILRRVGIEETEAARSKSVSFDLSRHFFVGREEELEVLDDAYEEMRAQGAVSAFVHGESGIGKSALVARFLARLQSREHDCLVLQSRCYERESVPFKAFDGVIDALSRHLVELPPVDAAMLVPLHITPLCEVFPVLRRSEVVAQALHPRPTHDVDPAEQRNRVFAALRDLFTRLATRHKVVIAIDDFQWADDDSLALLRALFRGPDEPRALLVATMREGSRRQRKPAVTSFAVESSLPRSRHLRLRGLPQEQASRLAQELMERVAPGLAEHAAEIVSESDGHPLFIAEMVQYGALAGTAPPTLHLESALWARVSALEPEALSILELVSLSDSPLRKELAAHAAQMSFDVFSRWVSVLRVANLVQTTGARRGDTITIFHDKVRRAVLRHVDGERQRHCHERLALALETTQTANVESLAVHWAGAGDRDKAYGYFRAAASQAARALAFERAARLYVRCLDFLASDSPEIPDIHRCRAEALGDAGRSAEAASAYLSAASLQPEREAELLARAAGHFVRSGHIDSGFEVLSRSLHHLGARMPVTPRAAMASLLWQRTQVRARGLRYRRRDEDEIGERQLARLDILRSLAVGLGLIDTIRGAEIQARHLLLALRAGEPGRVARALAIEAAYRMAQGGRADRSGRRVLAQARELAATLDEPEIVATVELMSSIGELCAGDYGRSAEQATLAEELLTSRCYGVQWEVGTARLMRLWSSFYLGRLGSIAAMLEEHLPEHLARGDRYAATTMQTMFLPLVRLAEDRPDLARSSAEEALRRWSQRGFHFQHYCHLLARTQVDLYDGQHEAAVERLDEEWPALKKSLLLSVEQSRLEAVHARGRAELALAVSRGGDERLLERVRRRIAALRRERRGWADGLAGLLEAGRLRTCGDLEAAVPVLDQAIVTLEGNGLSLYAAAARRGRGQLVGGDAGAAQVAEADAALRREKIERPAAMAWMLAPGAVDAP